MRAILLLLCCCLFCIFLPAQRKVILLDKNWKFIKGEQVNAASPAFDDSHWQTVTVPHDWAISGPFDKMIDAQSVTVTEDGEKKPVLRVGRTGSLPWTGIGWYRREITVPASEKNKKCFIEFDGAMSHSVVYLNGDSIGTWPYGYASFSFELTGRMKPGKNILAVRLFNPEESSRWYPGAGIYRNVRLVFTARVHINQWGTYITTPVVSTASATARIKTTIVSQALEAGEIKLRTTIVDPSGKQVAVKTVGIKVNAGSTVDQSLLIANPALWDIHSPALYTCKSEVIAGNKIVDVYRSAFGIRTIAFTNDKGFLLNGRPVKIKGVCNHHDLGPLGSAVNNRALQRQLELLKQMGCNAIRTSHNPPAPELLDLCDKMGFLVMDEAFDEWKVPKCKNGYNTLFERWAEKDMRAMIRRDRNHPSVILWSIGNEVPEQRDKDGWKTATFLRDIAHDEDSSRLVTSGFNSIDNAIKNGLADVVDVVGINYRTHRYPEFHSKYPQWKLLGSETNSAISSRDEYMFPVVERKSYKYENHQGSSYDLEAPNWGNAPDIEFALQDDNEYVAGEFVWTGFDYLGEPTPYNNDWPSHSSYFGIIDLAGLPKDRFYLYQSIWSGKKVLHILPHWTWPGREGKITPVHCYTSYNSAELFINGKSEGIRQKDTSKYGRYRLHWDSVRYEPGEIKIIAYDKKGRVADSVITKTAGAPFAIKLEADRVTIEATGKDISFITAQVVDKQGNVCPLSDSNIKFEINGAAIIRGVANGDAANIQSLTGSEMRAFHGRCIAVVQSLESKGPVRLIASAPGLQPGQITIHIEEPRAIVRQNR